MGRVDPAEGAAARKGRTVALPGTCLGGDEKDRDRAGGRPPDPERVP